MLEVGDERGHAPSVRVPNSPNLLERRREARRIMNRDEQEGRRSGAGPGRRDPR
ncbi:MAG: hypothetical protein MZV63_64970 [Marinilabiliales bacterium]|nr:hypothetical protein [Marinilabiliales bacterium]